jgi:hypothetical protein
VPFNRIDLIAKLVKFAPNLGDCVGIPEMKEAQRLSTLSSSAPNLTIH